MILGLFGLRDLWRADRTVARTIVTTAVINTLVIAPSAYWADETWGPRYLIPSAWLLVIPIAWWLHGRRRVRALAAVALVAIYIPIAGMFVGYAVSIQVAQDLSHQPVYFLHGPAATAMTAHAGCPAPRSFCSRPSC